MTKEHANMKSAIGQHKRSVKVPYIVKSLVVKSLVNEDRKKFGGKIFCELKSIFTGNVMEIVKIGKKLANCCNLPKLFLPPVYFTVQYTI